jgi:hypothetical protein
MSLCYLAPAKSGEGKQHSGRRTAAGSKSETGQIAVRSDEDLSGFASAFLNQSRKNERRDTAVGRRPSLFQENCVGVTNCEPHQKCGGSPAQVIGTSTERFSVHMGTEEAFEADPPDAFEVHRMITESHLRDTGYECKVNALNWQLWLQDIGRQNGHAVRPLGHSDQFLV